MWGSTIERLNKNPVTDTYFDIPSFDDCRSSADGGKHSVANFRSEHTGGVHFLYVDGSVHFVSENANIDTVRALSTIAGGETVSLP